MENLVKEIESVYCAFLTDATAQLAKGNKAAGTRARKASLGLERMMKDFRKASLEEAKK